VESLIVEKGKYEKVEHMCIDMLALGYEEMEFVTIGEALNGEIEDILIKNEDIYVVLNANERFYCFNVKASRDENITVEYRDNGDIVLSLGYNKITIHVKYKIVSYKMGSNCIDGKYILYMHSMYGRVIYDLERKKLLIVKFAKHDKDNPFNIFVHKIGLKKETEGNGDKDKEGIIRAGVMEYEVVKEIDEPDDSFILLDKFEVA
jgi:hypothetical protein